MRLPPPPDVAEPPEDAIRHPSGLHYKVLVEGTGAESPGPRDTVEVYYAGWTTDGKNFDRSIPPRQPAQFMLTRVIRGWSAGVQTMVKGQKSRFWIPEQLAYGGQDGAPQGMLVFDIELVDFR